MAPSFNSHLLNTFVAPGIAEFTRADIPDLRERFPEAKYWLANHFLSSSFRGQFGPGAKQVALGFIRRAYHAHNAYHDGRQRTLEYLKGNDPHNPRIRAYYDAIAQWEAFALQVSMAMDLYRWINAGVGAFSKGDASKEQRLHTIANQVKHLASCVTSGQCADTDTVPLWITGDGLHSFGVNVSFLEASEILTDINNLAELLQDPLSFVEQATAQTKAP